MTLERNRPATTLRPIGGGGFDDSPPDPDAQMARVSAGVYQETMPVAGMSVGEIRARHGQRLDIPPGAVAYLGGAPVGDDTVVRTGQSLSFIRHAGSKGVRTRRRPGEERTGTLPALADALATAPRKQADTSRWLRIVDDRVEVLTPEGVVDFLPVEDLLGLVTNVPDGKDLVWPPGVRAVLGQPDGAIFVHETPPRVVPLKWIAADSPARSGTGATYRIVSVSVPWTIVLCVFRQAGDGSLLLSGANECFFRRERLRSVDDALLFPALLNCSRSANPMDSQRSWICTQNMRRGGVSTDPDPSRRVARSIEALVEHLWETGFNYSPEASGMLSWFGATIEARVHPRLTSIDSWAEASARDPEFALSVPWLPAGQTLREAARRLAVTGPLRREGPRTARDVARLVLNRVRS